MRRVKRFVLAAVLVLSGLVGVAAADDQASAGVVATLNGQATVTRSAVPRPIALHLRDDVFVRDQIRTEPRALVRVLLGGKALITMRELSVLTVTEEAGRVTVDLASGKIGVAVMKGRMRPGEIIEIRSPNTIAAVRGTVFVVEVDPAPTGASSAAPVVTTRVHLLHGALDVSARHDAAQAVRLAERQSVVVSGNALGSVQPISEDAVAALTADLKPGQVSPTEAPADFTDGLMAREQDRAVSLAAGLLGGVQLGLNGPSVDGVELGVLAGTTVGSLGNTVGAVGNTLGATVGGLGNTAGGAVSGSTVGSVGGAVGGLGGTVAGVSGAVGGTVGSVGGTVGGVLSGLLSGGPLKK